MGPITTSGVSKGHNIERVFDAVNAARLDMLGALRKARPKISSVQKLAEEISDGRGVHVYTNPGYNHSHMTKDGIFIRAEAEMFRDRLDYSVEAENLVMRGTSFGRIPNYLEEVTFNFTNDPRPEPEIEPGCKAVLKGVLFGGNFPDDRVPMYEKALMDFAENEKLVYKQVAPDEDRIWKAEIVEPGERGSYLYGAAEWEGALFVKSREEGKIPVSETKRLLVSLENAAAESKWGKDYAVKVIDRDSLIHKLPFQLIVTGAF
jgi:hypothetical protein